MKPIAALLLVVCSFNAAIADEPASMSDFRETFERVLSQEEVSTHAANLRVYADLLARQGEIDEMRSLTTRIRGKKLSRNVRFEAVETIDAIRRRQYSTAAKLALERNHPFLIRDIRFAAIGNGELEKLERALSGLLPVANIYSDQSKVYGATAAAFGQLAMAYHQAKPDDAETARAIDRCLSAYATLAVVSPRPRDASAPKVDTAKVLQARRESDEWVFRDGYNGPAFVLALASTGQDDRLKKLRNDERWAESVGARKDFQKQLAVCIVTTGALDGDAIGHRMEFVQSQFGPLPEDVYSALAIRCLCSDRIELADRFAGDYVQQVLQELSQAVVDPGSVVAAVRDADSKLRVFAYSVQGIETPFIAKRLAEAAVSLVTQLARADSQSIASELKLSGKKRRQTQFPVSLSRYAAYFNARQLETIGGLQREIDRGLAESDQSPWATKPSDTTRLMLAVETNPEDPDSWLKGDANETPTRKTRFSVIQVLRQRGQDRAARRLLDDSADAVVRLGELQAVGGSVLGYVCESGTAEKAKWAKLAASLGNWTLATKLVDSMRDPIDRASGYRVIARSLAATLDAETVRTLTATIKDPDQRFSARLGVFAARLIDSESPSEPSLEQRWARYQGRYSDAGRTGFF
ncbi:MAG: hypothetical protein AAFX06_32085, partial [Planctomycetota bacterium]